MNLLYMRLTQNINYVIFISNICFQQSFSLFKKIPTWDDLTFLPGTLTRFVIEGYREKCLTKTVIGPKAKRPLELDIPIYIYQLALEV